MLSAAHSKAILRHASAGRLPDEVRWRPKRERLYDEPLRAVLASGAAIRLVEEAAGAGPFREWVDPAALRGVLGPQPAGTKLAAALAEHAHAALCFAGWVVRVEKDYGTLDSA